MSHIMAKNAYYKIRHRNPLQRYDRKSVMQYLGIDERTLGSARGVVHLFNARPTFGTQSLDDSDIISVEAVPQQQTYVNARW